VLAVVGVWASVVGAVAGDVAAGVLVDVPAAVASAAGAETVGVAGAVDAAVLGSLAGAAAGVVAGTAVVAEVDPVVPRSAGGAPAPWVKCDPPPVGCTPVLGVEPAPVPVDEPLTGAVLGVVVCCPAPAE
jgi:hypothetical protein